MKRLQFNSQGRLIGADSKWNNPQSNESKDEEGEPYYNEKVFDKLQTSDSLDFLKETKKIDNSKDTAWWSLYEENNRLLPIKFSNGKTQEDIVMEAVNAIKGGKKIVFIHGACGTGKSAIALNIARKLGKTSLVVPVKGLQRQYEEDYTNKKYVIKENGQKLKIAMITGRENHDSIFKPGASCADPFLPDTIKITEKNLQMLYEYYKENPLIQNKARGIDVKKLKRISIAPTNPYWSPIIDATINVPIHDARKKKYQGLRGRDFIFYHRKEGCSYYDQYLAYLEADVIIFNSAKYKIEVALDRKPKTEVDIIDEADEFLDSMSTQETLNLTKLQASLNSLHPVQIEAEKVQETILDFLNLEFQNKKAIGIDEKKIFKLKDTHLYNVLKLFCSNTELQAEIEMDELSYTYKALEIADMFSSLLNDTYVIFSKKDEDLICSLVTTNLSEKLKEVLEKGKAFVFMSGTLHEQKVLKEIFGIEDFAFIEAETSMQGTVEIHRTGKEIDCTYSNLKSNPNKRGEYLIALETSIKKSKKPILVHVNSFDDLPSETEKIIHNISEVISKEHLQESQMQDKTGRLISDFKNKLMSSLFSTRCSRGVDFPGDQCNSIVFTKYPNPNVQGVFWKILKETHPSYYWDFYRDKARREFLQRIYRGLRSKNDFVYILSPDIRVLNAISAIQKN